MEDFQIIVFGDICPDNDFRELFDSRVTGPFSKQIVQDIISSKLALCNLECPATNNNVPILKCGPNLRALPKDIGVMKSLGFHVLSLANNHILDYGLQAVEETIELCNKGGIRTLGAGKNCEEAKKPVIYPIGNKKVGIISFAEAEFNLAGSTTPGAHHFDPYASFKEVEALKTQTDYVIVLYHGGIEYYKYPSPLLQKKCRRFTEVGANLVLCQHSHCIGTMEVINGSTILYGQGNAAFGYRKGHQEWNEGLVVKVNLNDKNVKFELLKATADGVSYAKDKDKQDKLNQIFFESVHIDNNEWVRNQWGNYVKGQAALDLPLLYGKNRIFNKLNRIFNNKLIEKFYSRKRLMTTMNIIRCEAHHEVVQTILEDMIL